MRLNPHTLYGPRSGVSDCLPGLAGDLLSAGLLYPAPAGGILSPCDAFKRILPRRYNAVGNIEANRMVLGAGNGNGTRGYYPRLLSCFLSAQLQAPRW